MIIDIYIHMYTCIYIYICKAILGTQYTAYNILGGFSKEFPMGPPPNFFVGYGGVYKDSRLGGHTKGPRFGQ